MTGWFRPGGAAVRSLGRKPQEYCPETPSPEPRRGGRGRSSAAPPGLRRRDGGLFISWGLRPRLLTAAPSGLGTSNPAPVALLQSPRKGEFPEKILHLRFGLVWVSG
jgi:hypothetical protein